jgi:hypothetical protein
MGASEEGWLMTTLPAVVAWYSSDLPPLGRIGPAGVT